MSIDLKDVYFAGLIDGEGCIGVYKFASGVVRPIIKVNMTCETTIHALHDHFGGYFGVKKIENLPNRKPQWVWEVTHERAREVCERLLPYLLTKRDKALELLATPKQKRGPKSKK